MAKKKRAKASIGNKKQAEGPVPQQYIEQLDEKHELFCQFYAKNSDTFCNATHSYAEAYNYQLDTLSQEPTKVKVGRRTKKGPSEYDKAVNTCAVNGNRLLRNAKIQARIRELLNEMLDEKIVDSELAKLILQDDDRPTKRQAISEFNKLRGRIIDKTRDVTEQFTMDDIRTLLAPLPPERQDEVYATITAAIAEADQLRRGSSKI